jgi:hypothetical protein
MVNALTPLIYLKSPAGFEGRLMMNKSLRGRARESSRNRFYGFRRGDEQGEKEPRAMRKKRAAERIGGFES